MPSSRDNKKARGRPATGMGTLVGVRLQPGLLGSLDAWLMANDVKPKTRPEAVRQLLAKVLDDEQAS